MKYLLDTCIVSELIAKQPNLSVLHWLDTQPPETLYLSVVTLGEIAKGICKLPESQRKSTLTQWLNQDLLERFSGRIQTLDIETMLVWGGLVGSLEQQARSLPVLDSLIAAIALRHSSHLVTRNVRDFDQLGVEIFNPFTLKIE
ncbi:type II toxin-antitoxin system VapC family toxin [Phormidesmis sp. 146-35]